MKYQQSTCINEPAISIVHDGMNQEIHARPTVPISETLSPSVETIPSFIAFKT